jgi:polysaccharide biosynthesis/export protein
MTNVFSMPRADVMPPRRVGRCSWLLALGFALLSSLTMLRAQTVARAKEPDAPGAHPTQTQRATSAGSSLDYLIGADDVLNVYVIDVPELSRDYRVSSDGTITIPLLSEPITAEGLTLNQLSAVIADRLQAAGLITHPNVMATAKTSQSHAVAITGAVQTPQLYPLFGPTTLLDVLSQAGGLANDAGTTATITRGDAAARASWLNKDPNASANDEGTIKVDVRKLLATGDPSLNLAIYPGDKITVQRAGVVYVVGAVHRPGGFTLSSDRDNLTVLQALALGEGLTSTALQKKAIIIRRGLQFPNGREEVAVDLKKILAGHASDPDLKPNDILFVPDSTSKRAMRRGAEAAIQIATGIVIWGRY